MGHHHFVFVFNFTLSLFLSIKWALASYIMFLFIWVATLPICLSHSENATYVQFSFLDASFQIHSKIPRNCKGKGQFWSGWRRCWQYALWTNFQWPKLLNLKISSDNILCIGSKIYSNKSCDQRLRRSLAKFWRKMWPRTVNKSYENYQ